MSFSTLSRAEYIIYYMNMNEIEYLEKLTLRAEEDIEFFSAKLKPERERRVCAAFLRCLGISFKIHEIESYKDEPPDVIFRSAKFEIMELLEADKRRHQEVKERAKKYRRAIKLSELFEPYHPSKPITLKELVIRLELSLEKKAQKYGKDGCSGLDILVYVDLDTMFLKSDSPLPDLEKLVRQGWRSVSITTPPYSHVFFANKNAPEFLCRLQGQTLSKWDNSDTFFELENDD